MLPGQEPWIAVAIAFLVIAVGSISISGYHSLSSSSTEILGCTSKAGLLGERRVSVVAKHGESVP